jgi:hypothetical protein
VRHSTQNLGEEGTAYVVEGLAFNQTCLALDMTSNGVGPLGTAALCQVRCMCVRACVRACVMVHLYAKRGFDEIPQRTCSTARSKASESCISSSRHAISKQAAAYRKLFDQIVGEFKPLLLAACACVHLTDMPSPLAVSGVHLALSAQPAACMVFTMLAVTLFLHSAAQPPCACSGPACTQVLPGSSLQTLVLSTNSVGDEGAELLAKTLSGAWEAVSQLLLQ